MPVRMTSQREIILQELQKSRQHLTADELYRVVRKKMPRISLATVYRNLELLSETGVIAKLEVSGRQRHFDSDVVGHDHVSCVQCHKVENVLLEGIKEDCPSRRMRTLTTAACRISCGSSSALGRNSRSRKMPPTTNRATLLAASSPAISRTSCSCATRLRPRIRIAARSFIISARVRAWRIGYSILKSPATTAIGNA